MKIPVFFILSSVYLWLLVMHSYYRKGTRLTVNFFLFAFILIFTHGGSCDLDFLGLADSAHTSLMVSLVNTFLSLPIFYLSWYIAEEVVKHSFFLKKRLFAAILLAGLIITIINSIINIIGINAMLMGNLSFIKLFWFFTHFFAAFLLINCSKYKYRAWKTSFFLLLLIYIWIIKFSGIESVFLLIEGYVFLMILIFLAFFNSITLDYSGIKLIKPPKFLYDKLIDIIPFVVLVAELALLVVFSVN